MNKQDEAKIHEILNKVFGEGIACQYDYSLKKLSLLGINERREKAIKDAIQKLEDTGYRQIDPSKLTVMSHKEMVACIWENGSLLDNEEGREPTQKERFIWIAQWQLQYTLKELGLGG